jgi:hypothetical protein
MWTTILARFFSITFNWCIKKKVFRPTRDLFHFDEVLRMFESSFSKKNHSSTHDERIVYVMCPCESLFNVERGVYAKRGANKLHEVNIFCLRKWGLKRGETQYREETQIYSQFPLTTCSIQLIGDSENFDPERSPHEITEGNLCIKNFYYFGG